MMRSSHSQHLPTSTQVSREVRSRSACSPLPVSIGRGRYTVRRRIRAGVRCRADEESRQDMTAEHCEGRVGWDNEGKCTSHERPDVVPVSQVLIPPIFRVGPTESPPWLLRLASTGPGTRLVRPSHLSRAHQVAQCPRDRPLHTPHATRDRETVTGLAPNPRYPVFKSLAASLAPIHTAVCTADD